jgi:hypothetical protein
LIKYILDKVVLIFASALTILPILTSPPAKGATASEYHAFFECNSITDVSPHEGFSCDRAALFIKGQCEAGTETVICDAVNQYILDHGLGNERRLTQEEVAEDFRIINSPETDEEKTDMEKSMDELEEIYRNAPSDESEPKTPGEGLFD